MTTLFHQHKFLMLGLMLVTTMYGCVPVMPAVKRQYPPARDLIIETQCKVKNTTVSKILSSIKIKIETKSVSYAGVRCALTESLNFLVNNFGSPLVPTSNISLVSRSELIKHASVELTKDGHRNIMVSPLNFVVSQRHFLVHELFHALYQTDKFIRAGGNLVEGGATYAQYKYLYRDKPNIEIAKKIEKKYHFANNIRPMETGSVDFYKMGTASIWRSYAYDAYLLFLLDHNQVLAKMGILQQVRSDHSIKAEGIHYQPLGKKHQLGLD